MLCFTAWNSPLCCTYPLWQWRTLKWPPAPWSILILRTFVRNLSRCWVFPSLNWGEMIFYCCFNLYSLMIEFEHQTPTSTTVFWVSFCINHLIHISVHFSAGIAFFFFFFTNVPCVCISPWSAWSTSFFSQSAVKFTHSILCGSKRIHV